MTFHEAASLIEAEVGTGQEKLDHECSSGYASDMLSDVMANAKAGHLWFTIQTHPNVIAVTQLLNLGAIVFTGGHQPEAETLSRAKSEAVITMTTKLSTYEAIARLAKAGL